MLQKQSEAFHTFLWHFSKFKTEFHCIFEGHKRFKEGRESVRDYERCGSSKEVNKPELIGQRVNHKDLVEVMVQ